LLTDRQTDKQTKTGKNITSLAEVIMTNISRNGIPNNGSGYARIEPCAD